MIAEAVCPDDVGARIFSLALLDPSAKLAAHQPVTITVDWSDAGDAGIVGPFEVLLTSGTSQPSFQRRVYRDAMPETLTFYPREGGPHLLVVREIYHQQYVGVLRFEVAGDRLEPGTI